MAELRTKQTFKTNKFWRATSASLTGSAWPLRSSRMSSEWRPSAEIRKRRSRARSWTLTSAFMHLSVTASCLRTRRPRTSACSRTMPRSALNALRAFTHPATRNSEGTKKKDVHFYQETERHERRRRRRVSLPGMRGRRTGCGRQPTPAWWRGNPWAARARRPRRQSCWARRQWTTPRTAPPTAARCSPAARTSSATAGSTSAPSRRRRASPSLLPAGAPPASGSTCPTPPSTPQREKKPQISPPSLPISPYCEERALLPRRRGETAKWANGEVVGGVPWPLCVRASVTSPGGAVRSRFKFWNRDEHQAGKKGKPRPSELRVPTLSDFGGRGATVQAGAVEKASFAAHALTFFRSMGFEKDALLIARLFRGTGRWACWLHRLVWGTK